MYEFSRFRFDPENHLLESEGNPVLLTPKAFEILFVLVQNGARLTSKEELMQKVWPDSFVEEANLTVNISALRKHLGEAPNGRQYIETVPKKGYRFAVPVRLLPNNTVTSGDTGGSVQTVSSLRENYPGSLTAVTVSAARVEKKRRFRWGGLVVAMMAVVLAVLAVVGYRAYRNKLTSTELAQAPHRLAVLPFQNLQADANTDFLGFSLADAIITKLGYVNALAVRPSYAVQKYRDQAVDIRRVAQELDVDTLLTGTFFREGNDLRIACQLIDVKTDNILWKGTFDTTYDKLLTVQDRVAEEIIRGLELTLSPSEAGRLKTEEAISPLAFEYYLRGIDLYSKGDFSMAIKMLEKSTELAPKYALAWANLGRSYTANASFRFGGAENYRKAEEAFQKAISLRPDEVDARVFLANMFTDTGRVEKAVPLLREALKTNPNHAEAHWELSYAYRFGGMLQEAVAECERARQLDPVVKLTSSTPNGYLYLGQYERFLESLPAGEDAPLVVFYRGLGEYYRKNWHEAATNFDRAFELDRALFQAQVGKAFSFRIRSEDAEAGAILHGLESKIQERGAVDPEATYKVAQAYAAIGDKTSALRVLRHSIEHGFFPYPYFATDPLLDPLRGEAEFAKLMDAARQRHEAFKATFF